VRKDNPWRYVERFPVERRAKYVPAPAEVRELLMAADGELRLYLEILAETAARPSEARVLAWEDVQAGGVILKTRKTRDGSRIPRRAAISQELADRFRAWRRAQGPGRLYVFQREDRPEPREATWGPQAMRTLVDRINETRKEGQEPIVYFAPKCLRHYRASSWAAAGVALTTIQARLGHTMATTTNNYLQELRGA
jgi:integrase